MIQSFETFEQMTDYLQAINLQASQNLHDRQRELTFGSYGVTIAMTGDDPLVIFAKFFTEQEYVDREVAAGGTPDEAAYTWSELLTAESNDRLFGEFYSVLEPRGELGSTHRINYWPIDEATFEWAQELGWRYDQFPEDLHSKLFDDHLIDLAAHIQRVQREH